MSKAGWPSTTGNPSGGGRDNNPPRKQGALRMHLRLQVSGLKGVGLFSPETVDELETMLGHKVVLLKEPRSEFGLGSVVNVFKTAQSLNMHLDIGDK